MLKTVVKNVRLPYGGIKKIIKGFEDGGFLIKDFDKQAEDKQDEQPSTSKDEQGSEESEEDEEFAESEEFKNDVNLDWINGAKEQSENLKNKTGKIGFVQFNKKGK